MVDDKEHLFDKDEYQRQIKREMSRLNSQQFANAGPAGLGPEVISTGLKSNLNPISDQFLGVGFAVQDYGTIGFVTQNIDFDFLGAQYNKFNLDGDVTFGFKDFPFNRAQIFTVDITIDTATPPVIIWPASVKNLPASLPTANGSRYLLHMIGYRDDVEERYEVIGGGSASADASQWATFPAVSNVDMAKFLIFNLTQILFDDTVGGFASATNPSIYYDFSNTELVIQSQSNTEEIVFQAGSASADKFARMDKTLTEWNLVAGHEFRINALHVFEISQFDGDMTLDVPTPTMTGNPVFKINAIVTDADFGGDLGTSTLPWNNLNVEQIRLRAGTVIIDIPSITRIGNNMVLNVNTGAQFDWRVLNSDIMRLSATALAMVGININMNGNNIDDIGLATVDNLIFNDAVGGVASATNPTIYYDLANTELVIQTQSNTEEIVLAAGNAAADKFARMDKTLTEFNLITGHEFRINALHVFEISQFDGEMVLDVPTPSSAGNPNFKINAVVTDANFGGDLGTASLPWNNLNIEQIRFREGDDITNISSIATRADKLRINVATADTIALQVNGVIEYDFSATAVIFTAGNNIILQGSGAAGFLQIGEITDPAAGTDSGKFYVKDVGGISKPFFIGDGQAAVDLAAGGGGPPFDDNQVIIQDEVDNTKTLTFNLSALATGNAHLISFAASTGSRTFTFPDNTGTMAMLNRAQTWTALQTFDVAGRGILMTNSTQIEFENTASNLELKAGANLHDPADPTITTRAGFEIDLNTGAVGDTEVFQVGDGNNSPWFQVDDDSARFESIILGSSGGHKLTFAIDDIVSSGETIATLRSQARFNTTVWTEYAEIQYYVDTASTTLNNNVGGMRLRCKQNSGNLMIDLIDMTGDATSGELGFYKGTLPVAQQTVIRVVGGEALSVTQARIQALQDALDALGLVLT